MNYTKWLNKNTESLIGKTVAVTGSTGGIGRELCTFLATLGADLILVDRNPKLSGEHKESLHERFPKISVRCLSLDLEDVCAADRVCEELTDIDVFIHNAGAYSIPRHKCTTGYGNVFQINFATPYYMIRKLLPSLRKRGGKVVVVGSIAHNYSKTDTADVDFETRDAASKVYGNAKRFLMFALFELFKNEKDVTLSVCHPGITFTNITAHYPKLIFAVIKHPMKVIFMKPKTAALSILKGVFDTTEHSKWIGPRIFDVWGLPNKKKLKTCLPDEAERIADMTEEVFGKCESTVETSKT